MTIPVHLCKFRKLYFYYPTSEVDSQSSITSNPIWPNLSTSIAPLNNPQNAINQSVEHKCPTD